MPTHARSYLAIRVSIDGNEGHGLVPGSPRSADTPRSNPALISLTTGPNCTRTQALQDQRLLAVLLQGKKKAKKRELCYLPGPKPLPEHPERGKSWICWPSPATRTSPSAGNARAES